MSHGIPPSGPLTKGDIIGFCIIIAVLFVPLIIKFITGDY